MGEPISDCRFKDIMVQGSTDEYKNLKLMIYRAHVRINADTEHYTAPASRQPVRPER